MIKMQVCNKIFPFLNEFNTLDNLREWRKEGLTWYFKFIYLGNYNCQDRDNIDTPILYSKIIDIIKKYCNEYEIINDLEANSVIFSGFYSGINLKGEVSRSRNKFEDQISLGYRKYYDIYRYLLKISFKERRK